MVGWSIHHVRVCVLVRARVCLCVCVSMFCGLVLGLVVEGACEWPCCASGRSSGRARVSVRVRKCGWARACIDDSRAPIKHGTQGHCLGIGGVNGVGGQAVGVRAWVFGPG